MVSICCFRFLPVHVVSRFGDGSLVCSRCVVGRALLFSISVGSRVCSRFVVSLRVCFRCPFDIILICHGDALLLSISVGSRSLPTQLSPGDLCPLRFGAGYGYSSVGTGSGGGE